MGHSSNKKIAIDLVGTIIAYQPLSTILLALFWHGTSCQKKIAIDLAQEQCPSSKNNAGPLSICRLGRQLGRERCCVISLDAVKGQIIVTSKSGQISLVGAIYQALSANLGCFVFKTNVCVNDVFAQSPNVDHGMCATQCQGDGCCYLRC